MKVINYIISLLGLGSYEKIPTLNGYISERTGSPLYNYSKKMCADDNLSMFDLHVKQEVDELSSWIVFSIFNDNALSPDREHINKIITNYKMHYKSKDKQLIAAETMSLDDITNEIEKTNDNMLFCGFLYEGKNTVVLQNIGQSAIFLLLTPKLNSLDDLMLALLAHDYDYVESGIVVWTTGIIVINDSIFFIDTFHKYKGPDTFKEARKTMKKAIHVFIEKKSKTDHPL